MIDKGAYSELDASRIVREVASALLFLHGIGLVHADLKPEVKIFLLFPFPIYEKLMDFNQYLT